MTHLFVIGTGLMGASFALAARQCAAFSVVTGFDTAPGAARQARLDGVLDHVATDLDAGVAAADAVLVAVPTGSIATAVASVAAAQHAAKPIFDLGSVKAPILAALRASGGIPPQFVPCHPMAGSEAQGAGAADAGLFRGRRVFLTPHEHSDAGVLERVAGWWRQCGADVVHCAADQHDRAVALTSHLPHLVAYAYMAHAGGAGTDVRPFAGPGFRDFTRIAASDPTLWRHILLDNRTAVLAALDGLVVELDALKGLLVEGRAEDLEAALRRGQASHRHFAGFYDADV
jgi:prephenate dehydrogenase